MFVLHSKCRNDIKWLSRENRVDHVYDFEPQFFIAINGMPALRGKNQMTSKTCNQTRDVKKLSRHS